MSTALDDRVLTGARWSEAVRCMARAEYQGLNTTPTNDRPRWLEDAFDRGVPVGEMWGLIQGRRLESEGHEISLEHRIPWGPPEYNWVGHADILDITDATIDEAYHSALLEFREEKALQAAGYAIGMENLTGRPHRAVLTAVNAADGDRTGGMAIKRYPVDVGGLRERVLEIQARVVTAVALGVVNPDDKISQTPNHAECKACVFANLCHAGYVPPAPDDVVGLEDSFQALRIATEDVTAAEAKAASAKQIRDDLRDTIREYLQPGVPVLSGDTVIKVIEVRGRTTVSLTDYTKAGFAIPEDLEPFVKQGRPSERWFVEKSKP